LLGLNKLKSFPATRTRKRQFHFENEDEPQTPEIKFKVEVFYALNDQSLASIHELLTHIDFFPV